MVFSGESFLNHCRVILKTLKRKFTNEIIRIQVLLAHLKLTK